MAVYQMDFDRLVQQVKEYKISLPDPVLAYWALRSSNITEENVRLIPATVNDNMMDELKKVMDMDWIKLHHQNRKLWQSVLNMNLI